MKKIIGFIIVCSFFLAGNKTFAVLWVPGMSDASYCQSSGGIYQNNTCRYSCNISGGVRYFSSKDNEYNQCIIQAEEEREKIELEAKQKIFDNRNDTLSEYKDFFEKIGVNLTIDTSSGQYDQWLRELKEAKNDYIKDQENEQKIKELEERINSLESKPVIINETLKPTKEIINNPVSNNKVVKPVIKKEEVKEDTAKQNESPVIETPVQQEPPVVHENKSIFRRIFNWFKSLGDN
jgi:vacuolar-type H+-ATPase subunit I/STV1